MGISWEEALGLPRTSQGPTAEPKMQQNATVTPCKLAAAERTQKLIDGILGGKTVSALAKELDVDRATLYRDFDEWVKSSEVAHLHLEWLSQYEAMKKKNPEKALECLTRLLCRVMEKQSKVEVNVTSQTAVTVADGTVKLLAQLEQSFSEAERLEAATVPKDHPGESLANS